MFGLTWECWPVLAAAIAIPHAVFLMILKLALARARRFSGRESGEAFWGRLQSIMLLPAIMWAVLLGGLAVSGLVVHAAASSIAVKLGAAPSLTIVWGLSSWAYPAQLIAAAVAFKQASRKRELPPARLVVGLAALLFLHPWALILPVYWFFGFVESAREPYGHWLARVGDSTRVGLVALAFCALLLWLLFNLLFALGMVQESLQKPKPGSRPQPEANGPPPGPSAPPSPEEPPSRCSD
jgi:hypothetical protein